MAKPEDSAQIVEWLNLNKGNLFDPDVLSYPTLRVLCAYNKEPVSYLPTQRALVLESVAVNPKAGDLDRAQALRDLVKGSELLASSDGIREIFLFGKDTAVLDIAEARGFELLPWPVLRMKL